MAGMSVGGVGDVRTPLYLTVGEREWVQIAPLCVGPLWGGAGTVSSLAVLACQLFGKPAAGVPQKAAEVRLHRSASS